MKNCYCGSEKSYTDCCSLYIDSDEHAPTPEALMRSRYSAYCQAKVDYIAATMAGKASLDFNPSSAAKWANEADWLGLTVVATKQIDPEHGVVSFFARYQLGDEKQYIYEKSKFEKISGRWFYVDGEMLSLNKNQACPCGSSKKFKRCCL